MHNRHHPTSRRAAPLLSVEWQEELRQALAGPAPEDDRWSGRTVAAWMSARLGRPVARERGWISLQRLKPTPRHGVPRPRHALADPEEPAACKKPPPAREGGGDRLPPGHGRVVGHGRAPQRPQAAARAGSGRRPVRGPTPSCSTASRGGGWSALSIPPPGAPSSLSPQRSVASCSRWSSPPSLARWERGRTSRSSSCLTKPAGQTGHTSPALQVPEHLHRLFLPAYSPELQPAEHLWPLTNTVLINRHFADLEELEDAQARRCVALQQRRDLIRSATRFHWWPLRIKKRQGPRTT